MDKGAEFILTNYFYDNRAYFDFVDACRRLGLKVPIVPGIMPIFSVKMMNYLANLCGAAISDDLRQRLAAVPEGDIPALLKFGINFAFEQCKELIRSWGARAAFLYHGPEPIHDWGPGAPASGGVTLTGGVPAPTPWTARWGRPWSRAIMQCTVGNKRGLFGRYKLNCENYLRLLIFQISQ